MTNSGWLNPLSANVPYYETERIAHTQILQERSAAEGERAYKNGRVQHLANSAKNWTIDEFDDWLYTRHYKPLSLK